MSDGTIQLRLHWAQLMDEYGRASDINVLFYEVDSDWQVAAVTVPNTQEQTTELVRTYRHPDTKITLPSAFLDSSTSADERLDMFRAALFEAAAD